ncbi:MAG TPA: hypothetical protein VFE58_15520 [Tepidisphaeraceae bacterium]|jgi:hypothetical protein|nr:hypothetical protein [Tepidisphaeraceae bacterium]
MGKDQPNQAVGTPEEPAVKAADDPGYEVPKRAWFVHGAIIVAFALFFSMLMLLYVRWVNSPEPTSTLLFFGGEKLDGIQVDVEGLKLDGGLNQKFSADNQYRLRFLLPPGNYVVRIMKNGMPILRDTSITMRDGAGQEYDLGHILMSSTTAPTTRGSGSQTQ